MSENITKSFTLLLFVLLVLLQSCTSTKYVSPYFKYNQYNRDFNQLISNDSLKILHQSFGDVKFETKKKKVNRVAAKSVIKPENVLLYGKTVLPPHYEYFVLLGSDKVISGGEGIFIRDTLVNGHQFTFVGIAEDVATKPRDFDRLAANFFVLPENEKRQPIGKFMNQFSRSYNYFKAVDQISKFEATGDSEEWFRYQMELNYASFLGESSRYRDLLKKFEGNLPADSIVETIERKGVSGIESVGDYILEKAANYSLIMFNENHFYPSHRMLLTALLPRLKAAGFNYLAMEAITPGEENKLNNGGEITFKTGFYTREQRFGDLIRAAQQLGIKIISYESNGENREINQADNLYNNTFKKDPAAKVIVYAGISHILEKPDARNKKWMAAWFKEKYQIDPLTFSQTDLLRYRGFVDDVCLLKSTDFENDRLQGVDFQIINNLSITDESGVFKFSNTFDFPVQLSLFINSNENNYESLVPLRTAIVNSGNLYTTHIDGFDRVKMVVSDIEGVVFKEEVVDISGR